MEQLIQAAQVIGPLLLAIYHWWADHQRQK